MQNLGGKKVYYGQFENREYPKYTLKPTLNVRVKCTYTNQALSQQVVQASTGRPLFEEIN